MTLLTGSAGALFLSMFFRSVRLRWPENYSTLRGVLEAYVSQGLSRYVAFRTFPVYAIGVFVWVSVERAGGYPYLAVGLMAIAHTAATNGRATLRLLRRPVPGENRLNLFSYYFASTVLVIAAAVACVLTAPYLRSLVPGLDSLAEAAWTGAFAAVLAVTLQSLGRRDLTDTSLLQRGRNAVPAGLWLRAQQAALRRGTDPDLLRAIVAAEALQRPAWLRRLERVKGRVVGPGTYGIAQVSADSPLSDEESIDELARRFQGYMPERSQYGDALRERLQFNIERHNSKRAFVDMVTTFYEELQGALGYSTVATASDGRPIIEVRPPEREYDRWVLSGTACVYEANIAWRAMGDDLEDDGFVTASVGAPARGEWQLRLPLAARRVQLYEPSEDYEPVDDDHRLLSVELE